MTELLEKAFSEVARLPQREQDRMAAWILEEIESERGWDEAFARSGDELSHLADEALVEHRGKKTPILMDVGSAGFRAYDVRTACGVTPG